MNRVLWFVICTVVGVELIAWGLLTPAHIRAVDAQVLRSKGSRGPSLAAEGLSLVNQEKPGPARMFLRLAEETGAPGWEKLAAGIARFDAEHPGLKIWGGTAPYLERVFEKELASADLPNQPIIDLLVSQQARDTLGEALRLSRRPAVLELLQTRELTNTVIFPPARSASGQPLDAAITLAALLYQQDHFTAGLRHAIQELAAAANGGGEVARLEMVYLDLLALGRRLDWVQLVNLMRHVPDPSALQEMATLVRERQAQIPVIYAAVHLSGSPGRVAKYLGRFPETGMKDLTFGLREGGAAVRDLLERQHPIHYPVWRDKLVAFGPIRVAYSPLARLSAEHPWMAFSVKYLFCLVGALLVARALTYLSPWLVEEILHSRPLLTGPQVALGLCLLFILLFFTESLVTRATPAVQAPLQIKIPVASVAVRGTISHQQVRAMIDKFSAAALVGFFVAQAIIYVFCRMKLAEIRRQTLPSKLKLRLLENEEHLFDAGLYFGFVGTVVSLILVSLGIIKPSLMAAYSSTSFGIIFVSITKIFHLRPYRRRLILDSEFAEREAQTA